MRDRRSFFKTLIGVPLAAIVAKVSPKREFTRLDDPDMKPGDTVSYFEPAYHQHLKQMAGVQWTRDTCTFQKGETFTITGLGTYTVGDCISVDDSLKAEIR